MVEVVEVVEVEGFRFKHQFFNGKLDDDDDDDDDDDIFGCCWICLVIVLGWQCDLGSSDAS